MVLQARISWLFQRPCPSKSTGEKQQQTRPAQVATPILPLNLYTKVVTKVATDPFHNFLGTLLEDLKTYVNL